MQPHLRTKTISPLFGIGLLFFHGAPAQGQTTNLNSIVERLDKLENANRALIEEVRALRRELAAARELPQPEVGAVEERQLVNDARIEEHAQTKVEASHRYPIRITGMMLFNSFLNSHHTGGSDNPATASLLSSRANAGATVRQTVLGLEFRGPDTVWQGKVHGSVFMDFFGGSSDPFDSIFHIRTARMDIDWKSRSFMVGLDKPLIAPRDPNSLARVGIPPLSGAGNLWFWQPQARFEQRFKLASQTGVRAQVAVFQTEEIAATTPAAFAPSLEPSRPALQGRFEFSHALGEGRRIEIAPGFHTSSTHVAGTSVPSRLVSLDWFANPWRKLEFTGTFFTGKNISNLGVRRQGFTITAPGHVIPVHATGGWVQFTYLATERLSFNVFGGQQEGRKRDLLFNNISRNRSYAGNFMYRLAPNVIVSFEALQLRTTYLGNGTRLNNHYDLALAYLF